MSDNAANRERIFTLENQRNFAALSGDYNPMHLDPVSARREMLGGVVVHGIHGFLWALDRAVTQDAAILSAKCRFLNPMPIDESLQVVVSDEAAFTSLRVTDHGGQSLLEAQVVLGAADIAQQPNTGIPLRAVPEACEIEQVAGRQGNIPLLLDVELASRMFGSLLRYLPAIQIAELLTLTTIVGMKVPGQHSIFSGFNLVQESADLTDMQYDVKTVREKFSMVDINVRGPSLQGTLKTFFRPCPQAQPGFEEIKQVIGEHRFPWQTALVVGGSRGLGEVTAKMIAATGGVPTITCRSGVDDARRIQQEIQAGGGQCHVLQLDVQQPELPPLRFDALYYFASPKIFVKRGGDFDPQLLERFRDFYVHQFQRMARHIEGLQYVFYPSSTAIDEEVQELAEYAQAKLEGEAICKQLGNDFTTEVVRIPRTATDQTLTLTRIPACQPLDVMREIMFCGQPGSAAAADRSD